MMQLKVTTPKYYGGMHHQFVFEMDEYGEEIEAHDFYSTDEQEAKELAYSYLEAYK